jgi:polar amino acid transport system substrate-binding protein
MAFGSAGPAFFAAVEAGNIILDESPNTIVSLKKLLAGRIDCHVNAALVIEATLAKLGASPEDRARVVEVLTIQEHTVNIGYTANAAAFPFKDDFADRVDAILTEMWETGEIQAIVYAYIGG